MIIDTSAIVAILRDEAGASDCARAIEKMWSRRVSAANLVESALVIDGSRDPIASRRFDEFFKEASISVEPVTLEQARLARDSELFLGSRCGNERVDDQGRGNWQRKPDWRQIRGGASATQRGQYAD